jgi:hypothetical protein
VVDNDLDTLIGRPGWSVDPTSATYRQGEGGWSARVRPFREQNRTRERYMVSVIDPGGRAQYTSQASTLGEATLVAERRVAAQNARQP